MIYMFKGKKVDIIITLIFFVMIMYGLALVGIMEYISIEPLDADKILTDGFETAIQFIQMGFGISMMVVYICCFFFFRGYLQAQINKFANMKEMAKDVH